MCVYVPTRTSRHAKRRHLDASIMESPGHSNICTFHSACDWLLKHLHVGTRHMIDRLGWRRGGGGGMQHSKESGRTADSTTGSHLLLPGRGRGEMIGCCRSSRCHGNAQRPVRVRLVRWRWFPRPLSHCCPPLHPSPNTLLPSPTDNRFGVVTGDG